MKFSPVSYTHRSDRAFTLTGDRDRLTFLIGVDLCVLDLLDLLLLLHDLLDLLLLLFDILDLLLLLDLLDYSYFFFHQTF